MVEMFEMLDAAFGFKDERLRIRWIRSNMVELVSVLAIRSPARQHAAVPVDN